MGADAFREALGFGRGPTAHHLAEELRKVRRENEALREAADAQYLALQRMNAATDKLTEELHNARTDIARNEREIRGLVHMLHATQYLALHQMVESPEEKGSVWYDVYPSYPFYQFRPEFHGDFSHRRPYLRRQLVRDGKHGYFVSLHPLPPSRTRPHAGPQHWESYKPTDHELVHESRMREVSAILRRPPAAPEDDSSEELRDAVKELRRQARSCWETELGNRENFLPCPAHAYVSAGSWLEDLPGFRFRAAEIRRRRRRAKS